MIIAVLQHLLVSTILAIIFASCIWIFHGNGPAFRYRLWLAAALSFGIPTVFFYRLGGWAESVRYLGGSSVVLPGLSGLHTVQAISSLRFDLSNVLPASHRFSLVLELLWGLGTLTSLLFWVR